MSDTSRSETIIDAEPARAVNEPPLIDTTKVPRHQTAYRSRFAALYIGLAVVAGGAIGAAIVFIARPDSTETPLAKDTIAATQGGEVGALQLASEVQRKYRLADGSELLHVLATRNTLQDGELGFLRVRFHLVQPIDALEQGDSAVNVVDNAIQYSLCGALPGCGIPGEPSEERAMLLRRMGLELAVRTMQRDANVDNVTVFLRAIEPPQGTDGYVLVFQRQALEHFNPGLLGTPIEQILPGAGTRMMAGSMSPGVANRVRELTSPNLYVGQYQLLGGRDALLQLSPAG